MSELASESLDATITDQLPAMTVVPADPVTDPLWARLATRPGAGLFTSPPWIAAVCGSYRFTAESRIAVDDAGDPVGGFAWVPVDDPRGRRLLSLPFSDRADPPVPDTAVWDLLFDAVPDDDHDTPFTLRCLDDSPAVGGARLRETGAAAWHGTPLSGDVDELHRRISSQSRRNIKAAQRGGVRVDVRDDLAAVRVMHDLHVRLRKHKYGLLAQPLEFFERIWQEFAPDGRCVTLLASVADEVIAAALFLEWNGVLYYKFGASVQERLQVRPNDAIYWTGIQRGLERGLGLVDWGLSDLDQPGLVGFKRKWATEERRLLTLRSGVARPRPGQQEFGDVLGGLTRLLTEGAVPDDVTARAGALLYRYFC
jgi:CelD/BcsL family acetyltransferase involved in cellulose biosynthesis